MARELFKSWAIGLLIAGILLGASVVGTHTPLEYLFLFLIPASVPATMLAVAITAGQESNAVLYGLIVAIGSLFYGAVVLFFLRYRTRKQRARGTTP